jgi:hypothetical protein
VGPRRRAVSCFFMIVVCFVVVTAMVVSGGLL